jgi:type II secretion system protein G
MQRCGSQCLSKPSKPFRQGFTLMEMVVALLIIALMAAVIAPNVISALDRARISAAHKTLQGLSQGIRDFKKDVGQYPSRLTQLVTPITTADRGACNNLYTGGGTGQVARWAGPYLDRNVEATGVPLGIGTATNVLFWNANTTIEIPNMTVELADALELDELADGSDGALSGNIRWTNLVAPMVSMDYLIPINGC